MNGEQLNYVDDEQPGILHAAIVVAEGMGDVIFAYLPSKRMACRLNRYNLESKPEWDFPRFWEHNGMCSLDALDDDDAKAKSFFEDAIDPLHVRREARVRALLDG
jgi:hypothetical protein